ncbi:hypothetical protein CC85DRAFT_115217 [Cutaneotrichosporon oleaginosum]|uniref:Uncharacterized protein n=1 Tax=Cutaneotrichosporon oleaginosum TaxID=879819 RepID=A0A0J0XXC4_9TREE|nr:uncharacterized protein CC85DRAFT_115217 [Cutaneotrichosporon oleaginosum]KLT45700.1 hypothetical protein CC85DRAFT_115217 [Cutaneotrichosporon oleaginosum]TXT06198.1 hypothetical protein COLE_05529 [Cutaneotrichosporon oleaginosum]
MQPTALSPARALPKYHNHNLTYLSYAYVCTSPWQYSSCPDRNLHITFIARSGNSLHRRVGGVGIHYPRSVQTWQARTEACNLQCSRHKLATVQVSGRVTRHDASLRSCETGALPLAFLRNYGAPLHAARWTLSTRANVVDHPDDRTSHAEELRRSLLYLLDLQ